MKEEKGYIKMKKFKFWAFIILAWFIGGIMFVGGGDSDSNSINTPETTQQESVKNEEVEVVNTEPIELSGTGQQATEMFQLQEGLRRFSLTHSGSGHFGVWLMDSNGNNVELLANDSGQPFDGSKAVKIKKSGEYLLDISANGNWTVSIE